MAVWSCLSVCQSQHWAGAEKLYQIWAGSCICVCTSQIARTLEIICIVQEVKMKRSWLFLLRWSTKEATQSHYKAMRSEKAQRITHWNMTVRANSLCQCANHTRKRKIALGLLMIPAAIQGKGTRATTCDGLGHASSLALCKRTALPLTWCSPLVVF